MCKKFPVLDIDEITTLEELEKLQEEVGEFIQAIENEDMDNMKEEFFDVIQVLVNIMNRYNLVDDLEDDLEVHIEKLRKRNWEIKKYI